MIVAIVVVVAVVAAVVGASSLIAYTKSPAVIEQQYVQPIDWESCGKPIQCAEIPVPLDWSTASSKRIYINVARHRATGTKLGSIVTDPGGPGGTGSGFVGNDVRGAVTKQIEEHYDVIGIDPRGVGGSEPIECGSSTVLDDYLYGIVPGQVGSSSWITATERAASTYAQACRTHSSEMIDHVDTVDAAMDMDLIRADLGESRLNYLGYSYGTELGSVYASIFPKRVGRFVLDGVVDIWNSPKSDPTVGQAAAFEGDLRAWMTACLAKSSTAVPSGKSCPFTGTTAEGMAAIRALLAHATTTPYVDTNGRELGAAQLATGISGDLYSEDEWPELTALFSGLKVGGGAPIRRLLLRAREVRQVRRRRQQRRGVQRDLVRRQRLAAALRRVDAQAGSGPREGRSYDRQVLGVRRHPLQRVARSRPRVPRSSDGRRDGQGARRRDHRRPRDAVLRRQGAGQDHAHRAPAHLRRRGTHRLRQGRHLRRLGRRRVPDARHGPLGRGVVLQLSR
jgi:pimeloyl-ACP methyl ester carboxylesterase